VWLLQGSHRQGVARSRASAACSERSNVPCVTPRVWCHDAVLRVSVKKRVKECRAAVRLSLSYMLPPAAASALYVHASTTHPHPPRVLGASLARCLIRVHAAVQPASCNTWSIIICAKILLWHDCCCCCCCCRCCNAAAASHSYSCGGSQGLDNGSGSASAGGGGGRSGCRRCCCCRRLL
jgi:hypothetical protein